VPPKLELLQGTLDLIVLGLLRGGPANGWDLTNAIQATSRGVLDVNYGSIYPALRRLEARGLVKGKWGTSDNNRRARFYELTTSGRKALQTERESWETFSRTVGLLLDSR
jgi:PadR family transcriptional regulator, regulatory protein PadR